MAHNTQAGTILTSFRQHSSGLRVHFSCPEDGYTLDDLDALSVAIEHAKRSLQTPAPTTLSAFATQQSRMAAPS